MIDKLGGRKTVTIIITMIVSLVVVALKGDLPPNLLMLLQTIFGAYVIGNGVEHVASKKKVNKEENYEAEERLAIQNESSMQKETYELLADVYNMVDAQSTKLDTVIEGVNVGNSGVGYLVEYAQNQDARVKQLLAKQQKAV